MLNSYSMVDTKTTDYILVQEDSDVFVAGQSLHAVTDSQLHGIINDPTTPNAKRSAAELELQTRNAAVGALSRKKPH